MENAQQCRSHSLTFTAMSNSSTSSGSSHKRKEEYVASRGTDVQVISFENKKRKMHRSQQRESNTSLCEINIYTNISNYTTTKSSICSDSVLTEYLSRLRHHESRQSILKTDTTERCLPHNISLWRTKILNRSMHRTLSAQHTRLK